MKPTIRIIRYGILLCALFAFTSCRLKTGKQLSENELSYKIPEARPFKIPEAKQINWVTHPTDSFPDAQPVKFNIDRLPSVPFRVNGFKPLKSPVSEVSFNWNKLEKMPIHLDTIKPLDLTVIKFMLPKPAITPASLPAVPAKGTSGVLKLAQSEGLIGNNVYAVITDKQGSVWMTTERGLIKYTGNEFFNYTFFLRDDASGGQELISDLVIDREGRLLITTNTSGVYRVNLKTNLVENFRYKRIGPFRLTIDTSGKIWANGLVLTDLDKRTISKAISPDMATKLQGGFGIMADREGNIWVGFKDKIGILSPDRKTLRFIGANEGLNTQYSYDFTEDKAGNVWISDIQQQGAQYISLKQQKVFTLGPKQGYFGSLNGCFIDKKDRVWLLCNDTTSVYDPKTSLIKKMFTGVTFFAGNNPASGAQDADGKIWMGTSGDGVMIIDPEGMLSEHFTVKDGLQSGDIWGIRQDTKGRVLLATYAGVNIYNPATERLSFLKFPPGISPNQNRSIEKIGNDVFYLGTVGGFAIIDLPANTMTFYNTRKTGISNLTFTSIKTKDGKIWAAGDKGVLVFDMAHKTVKSIDKNHGLLSNLAFVIKEDKQGRIWILTDNGASIVNPTANTIQNLNEASGLASSYTSMLLQSADQTIFIGTDKGLSVFDKNLKTITNVSIENGLIPLNVYDMLEVNGRIQLATDNGLIVTEKPVKKGQPWLFYSFAKSSGFPFNDYNQGTATTLSNGQVWWAATPYLIIEHQNPLIDTVKPHVKIKAISIMDQDPSFLKSSALGNYLTKGDTITIGNKKYTKDKLPEDAGYLTENNIKWDDVTSGFNIPIGLKLPYNQNSLSFSFTNQSIIGRDKIAYRYMLEGADKEWSDASIKTTSNIYYNLMPGNYAFKVITRGLNGQWSDPDTIKFTILSPWWQTWWAWLIYVAIFSGVVYMIVKTRSKMLERENKILEEKVHHRTKQLEKTINELTSTQSQLIHSEKMASLGELTAGIAHEIQNPLNFVNNFSELSVELLTEFKTEMNREGVPDQGLRDELLNDISQNLTKINHHGKRADAIVKGMLQHSRASSSQKEAVDINSLSDEYLRLSYHGLRAKDKSFNAAFTSDFDGSIGKVNIVPQDIGRVIMNLLTNAFYAVNEKKTLSPVGPDGKTYEPTVSISTKKLKDGIEIKISDNGTGIPPSIAEKIFQPFFTTKPTGKGTGLGLSMSYDIITKGHGGTLSVRSKASDENEGAGTEFTIYLPA